MNMWRLQHKYVKLPHTKGGNNAPPPAYDDRTCKNAMKSGGLVLLDQLADLGNRGIRRLAIGD